MELSRSRVLYLLLTTHLHVLVPDWAKLMAGIAVLLGAGVGGVFVTMAYDWPRVRLLWCLMIGACLYSFIAARRRPHDWWNLPVLALDEHPRLQKVLLEAVELAGARTVPKVRLCTDPSMGLQVRARRRLLIGLPLVTQLDEDEMRALMVRSLLIPRLWSWHEERVGSLNRWDLARAREGKPHPDRARLRAQHKRQRQELWERTAALVGRETLARAMRREIVLGDAFAWHTYRYVSLWANRSFDYHTDVYTSFEWKIRHDGLLERIWPAVDARIVVGDRHEAELLSELGWGSGTPMRPMIPPVFGPLPDRVEHRLGRLLWYEVSKRTGPSLFVKGESVRDKPAELWAHISDGERTHIMASATTLLGRPATANDVVRLAVEGRADELDVWHASLSCPHPSPAVCALMPLLDVALRRIGYLHEDPFRQRVLVGRLGDRVDVVELADKVAQGMTYGLELGYGMSEQDPDEDARRLAAESLAAGDPIGWFERLYAESGAGAAIVPWDSGTPHVMLADWASKREVRGDGRRALVVGCGLGDDAAYVAGLGFDTVAFDVSESAVAQAKERFPASGVFFRHADLFDPPQEWREAFDLVVEVMTVQALPEDLHAGAIERVASFVRPGGTLVVVASARDEGGPVFAPPWPLTPSEIAAFATGGLVPYEIEDFRDGERHRCRATFHRP
ncbi:methyltransferase domain-containing protein [Nonomuraea glycinis]|uniref:Methyltransferase domain-containing protein n=1 Tax=Nonomuraea glycinis TaxID=2047744 RepID=A0A918E9F3_9ACTN|nr:methyltransferase domain-containing protein [Nonomuraea glycinis]MCA2179789.1 methyltransferase domain-containing protein [Nonomuraea glycinis]GGP16588.1 hypothetical protein GCM10012278_81000 [Nonomuraea glycinis]